MGPLKAAAAHVSGERFCHGLGENLETQGVASPAANWTTGCGTADWLGFLVDRGALARGCAQSSTTYGTYRRVFG